MTKLVRIDFVLDGLAGREHYLIDVVCGRADAIAWGRLEERLIEEAGLRTHDCGCCVADDRLGAVAFEVSP